MCYVILSQHNLLSGGTCAKVAKTIDSGAGFFIEEDDEDGEIIKQVTQQPGNVNVIERKAAQFSGFIFMFDPL